MLKDRYIYKTKQESNIILLHTIKRVHESRIFFLHFNLSKSSHLCRVISNNKAPSYKLHK